MCNRLVIVLCMISAFTSYSQHPVSIGDQVPDLTILSWQNNKNVELNFTDLRGKLIVLDFWGVNCAPCIKAFVKLDSIQKKLKDKIQIILVTSNTKREIDSIFLKRSMRSSLYHLPDLPLISGDTILHNIFPHTLIPHLVWIDQTGIVSNVTDDTYLTLDNIEKVLKNNHFRLFEKKDLLDYKTKQPLLPQIVELDNKKLKYYSAVLKWLQGLSGGTTRIFIDSLDKSARMTRGFHPILMLYADALSEFRAFDDPFKNPYFDFGKRVILEVSDSSRYIFNPETGQSIEQWREQNCYAYEAVSPLSEKNNMYKNMLADLNKYFQIDGRLEKRRMKCMALVLKGNKDRIRYRGNRDLSLGRFYSDSSGSFHLYGTRMKTFRDKLAEYNQEKDYIFVDNTNYTGLIELKVNSRLSDIPNLRKELLLKYDLDLIETLQEIPVMVITEKK